MDVLVADDDDDIRYVVSALLSRRGWNVTTTAHGVETIDVLAASSFDVLVLDQSMPPGSGLEVIHHLRERGDLTPVVLFTGFSATLDSSASKELGVLMMEKTDVAALPDKIAMLAGLD